MFYAGPLNPKRPQTNPWNPDPAKIIVIIYHSYVNSSAFYVPYCGYHLLALSFCVTLEENCNWAILLKGTIESKWKSSATLRMF